MGLLDGLSRQEEDRFRALARVTYTGTLTSRDTWTAAVRALCDRQRDADVAIEAAYWRARKR